MTQNYKRIAKNTMFLYSRMLIIMAVGFYTVRIVLDTLGITDYGIYNLVASFVMILAFLNSTLTSGTQRFLTFEIGKDDFVKLKQTFSTALLMHIALGVIILVLAETIGLWFLYEKMNIPVDRFNAAFWAYQFAVFSAMVTVMQVPYNAIIIAHEKMHIFAYISIIEATLKLLLVYLLLIVSSDKLISYAIFMFIVSLIIAFTYRTYVIKNYKESHFEFVFERKILKSMMHFSGWSIFGAIASVSSNHGVNIILNIFFGPIAVAARAISMQVSGGLNQFVNGFQQAVTPQITKLYASNQIEELNKLLYQNAKYAFLLLWILALPVLIQVEYILNIWLIEVPKDTVVFTQLMIVHGLLYSLLKPFNMGIHAVGKMKAINLTSGITIMLVLPSTYVAFKLGYPNYSAIIIFIFFTFIQFYFQIYYLKRYINISLLSIIKIVFIPLLKVVSLTLLPIIYISSLFDENLIFFFNIIIFTIIINLFIIYIFGLNEIERIKIKSILLRKINSFSIFKNKL